MREVVAMMLVIEEQLIMSTNVLTPTLEVRFPTSPNSSTNRFFGRPILTVFDHARPKGAVYSIYGYETAALEAKPFEFDPYQHPDRQGEDDTSNTDISETITYTVLVSCCQRPTFGCHHQRTDLYQGTAGAPNLEKYARVRNVMLDLAQSKLADIMRGQNYQNTVVRCLTL
jgi:hypothetical protein